MSLMSSALVLTARGPEDLLGAVPYLIGFHPRDSVVVLFVESSSSTIVAVVRVDLADAGVPGRAGVLLAPMLGQVGERCRAVFVGYGDDPDLVGDVVGGVAGEIGVEAAALVVVCGGFWWHLEAPEDRRVYDPAVSQIAAEATFQGITAVPERADLEAVFRGRGGRVLSVVTMRAAVARVEDLTPAAARLRLGVLLDRQLDAGQVILRPRDCAELLLLLDVAPARDAFWLRLNRTTGALLMDVWLEVARRAPVDLTLAPVCAAGLAAWQGNTGTLVTIALERADEIGGTHPLHDLLERIHGLALPPSALAEITACLA